MCRNRLIGNIRSPGGRIGTPSETPRRTFARLEHLLECPLPIAQASTVGSITGVALFCSAGPADMQARQRGGRHFPPEGAELRGRIRAHCISGLVVEYTVAIESMLPGLDARLMEVMP